MVERRPLGFRTSSRELQDMFENIQLGLSKKKANWNDLQMQLVAALKGDRVKKLSPQQAGIELALILIATLGTELTETHERLARCEKLLQEIKAR